MEQIPKRAGSRKVCRRHREKKNQGVLGNSEEFGTIAQLRGWTLKSKLQYNFLLEIIKNFYAIINLYSYII